MPPCRQPPAAPKMPRPRAKAAVPPSMPSSVPPLTKAPLTKPPLVKKPAKRKKTQPRLPERQTETLLQKLAESRTEKRKKRRKKSRKKSRKNRPQEMNHPEFHRPAAEARGVQALRRLPQVAAPAQADPPAPDRRWRVAA